MIGTTSCFAWIPILEHSVTIFEQATDFLSADQKIVGSAEEQKKNKMELKQVHFERNIVRVMKNRFNGQEM